MKFDPSASPKPQIISAAVPNTADTTFNPAKLKAEMEQKKEAERIEAIDLLKRPLGPIKAWSFSRLMDFEECPYRIKLTAIDKAPSPSGAAADRGSQIHDHIERFIRGEHSDYTKEIERFRGLFERLRNGFSDARVEVEGDWGYDRQWKPTGWMAKDVWARIKLDAIEFEDETSANMYDWKTGRKFGNEMKHGQQAMTYAIGAFKRFPKLQFIKTSMIYVDKLDELPGSYTRQQAEMLFPRLNMRANQMTTATKFPAKPSMTACKWCPHAKIQEGYDQPICEFRYEP